MSKNACNVAHYVGPVNKITYRIWSVSQSELTNTYGHTCHYDTSAGVDKFDYCFTGGSWTEVNVIYTNLIIFLHGYNTFRSSIVVGDAQIFK